MSTEEKVAKLKKMSYAAYLVDVVKVHPDLLKYYHPMGQPAALITETTSAWWSFNWNYPGLRRAWDSRRRRTPAENLDEKRPDKKEPTQFHFPEGNGGVARLLVRSLIPESLPARGMADAEMKRVRYARLDEAGSPVRLRLSSTVVRVKNNHADPAKATETEVTYMRGGKAYRVRAKGLRAGLLQLGHSVHGAGAAAEAEGSAAQGRPRGDDEHRRGRPQLEAVRRRWAFRASAVPGMPVSGLRQCQPDGADRHGRLPGAEDARPADHPDARRRHRLQVEAGDDRARHVPGDARRRSTRRRSRPSSAGSARIWRRVLSDGGFDPAAEIQGITISRWGHGYAMGQNLLFDPDWSEDEYPWVVGRKRFGRITIANSDAEGVCLTQASFDQAHRAVDELMRRDVAWWNRVVGTNGVWAGGWAGLIDSRLDRRLPVPAPSPKPPAPGS